ncbi:MAG: DUF3224 domain-containing protein [Gemmatimonadaceae bacterium]
MTTHANAVFEVKSWDEKPYQELEGKSKLTRASVTKTYRGDITGEATSESLMFYNTDGSAVFAGLERLVAEIGGRAGTFVLQASGTYRDGTATCDCTVVPNSGSGELRGLRGEGRFVATHVDYPSVPFTLEYSFE